MKFCECGNICHEVFETDDGKWVCVNCISWDVYNKVIDDAIAELKGE